MTVITLALNVGPVPVRFSVTISGYCALFGEMTQRDPEFGAELDAREVARLTGLEIDDLDPALPPQIVSTGTAFAIVALRSVEALARLTVNQQEATPWLRERGARWFYVLGPTGVEAGGQERRVPRAHAVLTAAKTRPPARRRDAPSATWSSAEQCAAGQRIHVRQGVEIGRTSDLYLSARIESARVTDVRVAGSTVLVAKGKLFLP